MERSVNSVQALFLDEIATLNAEGKREVENVISKRSLMGCCSLFGSFLAGGLVYKYVPKFRKTASVATLLLTSIMFNIPLKTYEINKLKEITKNPSFKRV